MKIMKMTVVMAAFCLALIGFQSCNTTKPINTQALDKFWVLKTMNGEQAEELFENVMPNIQFFLEDTAVAGYAGCNRFNGRFSLNDKNEFSAPTLATTMMLCMHKHAEEAFLKNLALDKLVLSIDENGQLVFKKDGAIVLEFEEGTAPEKGPSVVSIVTDENIVGKWVLEKLGEEEASVFGENIPFIQFDTEKSTFIGHAGCNRMSGSYKLEDSHLTVGPIKSTKMACPSLEKENILVEALQNQLEASLQDGKLVLLKDNKPVLRFIKATDSEE